MVNSLILYDLKDEVSSLMQRAVRKIFGSGDYRVFLRPLGRFGKTTARLFTMRVLPERLGVSSVQYVCKVDTLTNIRREQSNTEKVKNFFPLIPKIEHVEMESKLGILVFKKAGDEDLKSVLDQCMPLFSKVSPDKEPLDRARKIIGIALEKLPKPSPCLKAMMIQNGFTPYLRDGIGIKHLQYYSHEASIVPGTDGLQWNALLERTNAFLDLEIDFAVGPIHGDLHPSNIMVDTSNNYQVSLIDFAWAEMNGIAAIDYAMMENSVHYMWAPFWLPEYFWKTIDKFMLKQLEADSSQKRTFLKAFDCDECLKAWGSAVWDMIATVRAAAVKTSVNARQFFTARTALLLGQAKFEEYSPPRIGAQLWRLLDTVFI